FSRPRHFSRPLRVLRQILRFCPIRCSLPLRGLFLVRLFFRARSRLSARCHLKLRFRSTSSFLVRPSSPAQPPAQSYNRKCSPLLDLLWLINKWCLTQHLVQLAPTLYVSLGSPQ